MQLISGLHYFPSFNLPGISFALSFLASLRGNSGSLILCASFLILSFKAINHPLSIPLVQFHELLSVLLCHLAETIL